MQAMTSQVSNLGAVRTDWKGRVGQSEGGWVVTPALVQVRRWAFELRKKWRRK